MHHHYFKDIPLTVHRGRKRINCQAAATFKSKLFLLYPKIMPKAKDLKERFERCEMRLIMWLGEDSQSVLGKHPNLSLPNCPYKL